MEIVTSIPELRAARARHGARSFGFVPTMGCLHRGHLALADRAKAENELAGMSIFVNPTQFGPHEDFNRYPRQFDADCALCREHEVDLVFAPSVEEMYPAGAATFVDVGPLGERLEGSFRPGHFRGVATIVTKLFNLAQPQRAYFGRKDAQQLAVITTLARDLDLPVVIVPCDTEREADGLARSSRNTYLTAAERAVAPQLFLTLQHVCGMLKSGGDRETAEAEGRRRLQAAGFGPIDYLAVVDPHTFLPADSGNRLIVVAAKLGTTRLIDNMLVSA